MQSDQRTDPHDRFSSRTRPVAPSRYTETTMIPLRDVIPSRTFPALVITIIALNAFAFLFELTLSDRQLAVFVREYGVVPATFSLQSVFTSMFLHGGWMHFLGNMLFLWIFGDNVEDRLGHGRFVVFYLLCGTVAALAHVMSEPGSLIPTIGASGAVAGVMGAYFVLYPHSRILTLLPLFIFWQVIEVPAVVFLGLWFVLQLFSGVGTMLMATQGAPAGGIAFWAHVAGFLAGVVLVYAFRRPERARVEWWERLRTAIVSRVTRAPARSSASRTARPTCAGGIERLPQLERLGLFFEHALPREQRGHLGIGRGGHRIRIEVGRARQRPVLPRGASLAPDAVAVVIEQRALGRQLARAARSTAAPRRSSPQRPPTARAGRCGPGRSPRPRAPSRTGPGNTVSKRCAVESVAVITMRLRPDTCSRNGKLAPVALTKTSRPGRPSTGPPTVRRRDRGRPG